MNLYHRLIENPLFFKWIYHPDSEINSYWANYLKLNPEEAETILEFKSKFEKHLQYKNEKLSESEKKALARRIIRSLEKEEQGKKRFLFVRTLLRYAALAILFLSLGGALMYLYMSDNKRDFLNESFSLAQNVTEPVLIIDNKEQIPIEEGSSELKYSNDGKVVINRQKVFESKNSGETPGMNTLVIPYGSRSTIDLADGTRVWLNAGSRLIYPSKFVDKNREVYLVGEAFFHVAKNTEHPFIVNTSGVSVKVLGTKFNVSAYPEDNSVQTVLTEGSVEIRKTNAGLFEESIILKPGQLAYWQKKTEVTSVYNVDTDYYTLWTDGIFSFANTDLNRIIKKLERYYNIRFQYADPMDGTIKISGKLDVAKDQKVVFEYLESLTGLSFIKINEWKYVIK